MNVNLFTENIAYIYSVRPILFIMYRLFLSNKCNFDHIVYIYSRFDHLPILNLFTSWWQINCNPWQEKGKMVGALTNCYQLNWINNKSKQSFLCCFFFSDHIPSYSEDLIRVLLIFFDSFIPYGPEATCMLCIGSPCTGYLRSLLEKRK